MFKDIDKAEIEVKKIELKAVQDKLKEVQPLVDSLIIEKMSLEEDIKHMEAKLVK